MKKIILAIALITLTIPAIADDAMQRIGEEYIQPLKYPKFGISGDYAVSRHYVGFAHEGLRAPLNDRLSFSLLFEAGLVKYFNAGALFSMSYPSMGKPITMNLGLFGKPYISLGERFAIFSRLSTGIATDLAFMPSAHEFYNESFPQDAVRAIYHDQSYTGMPFGGFGTATLGLEFFPLSRFGISVEGGIKASIFHGPVSIPFISNSTIVADAPGYNYSYYEFPLTVNVLFIL